MQAACLIRVPVEVIKQRRQALLKDKVSSLGLKTLYRGYGTTVLRDMPFGFTQMPLWEYFKFRYKQYMKRECTPLEGAICGAVSGNYSTKLSFFSRKKWNEILIQFVERIQIFLKSFDKIFHKISIMYKNS